MEDGFRIKELTNTYFDPEWDYSGYNSCGIYFDTDFNYFGVTFRTPVAVKYLATDENGIIIGYYKEPILRSYGWESVDGEVERLAECIFDGDWTKSLKVIER